MQADEVSQMKLSMYGHLTCLVLFVLAVNFAGSALAQLPPEWSLQDIGQMNISGAAFEENNEWYNLPVSIPIIRKDDNPIIRTLKAVQVNLLNTRIKLNAIRRKIG